RALKLAGFNENTPDPPGGELVRKDGRLTGRLNDAAAAIAKRAVPMPSTEVLAREFGNHCHRLNSLGITSSTEMGMLTIPDGMGFWNRVAELGNQTVRVAVYMDEPMYSSYSRAGLPFGFGSGLLRFQGRKILLDGGGGSGTARVSEPNLHDGKSGILYYTQEKLDSMIWEAHSKGRQVAVHAIGDVAIDMLIESYEKAYNNKPNGPMHRIEHAYFCFPPLLEKLKRLPVAATLNPGFIYYFGETHIRNYGIKRTDMEIPIRSFIDSNVLSALGSDNPVTVPDPFPIIYSAVSRKTGRGVLLGSGEAISISEALWAYTAASAALTGEETEKGTLSPGKLADITLLDKDPESFEKEPEGLLGIAVKETYLGGKLVFGS
ncbi:MAG: amidohydrolase family protein, partial [Clostridiales bacterium]|nr:amidohydrolase family protein [Clostridiales bacterium]